MLASAEVYRTHEIRACRLMESPVSWWPVPMRCLFPSVTYLLPGLVLFLPFYFLLPGCASQMEHALGTPAHATSCESWRKPATYAFHTEQIFGSYRDQSYSVSLIHQAILFPHLLGKENEWPGTQRQNFSR